MQAAQQAGMLAARQLPQAAAPKTMFEEHLSIAVGMHCYRCLAHAQRLCQLSAVGRLAHRGGPLTANVCLYPCKECSDTGKLVPLWHVHDGSQPALKHALLLPGLCRALHGTVSLNSWCIRTWVEERAHQYNLRGLRSSRCCGAEIRAQ